MPRPPSERRRFRFTDSQVFVAALAGPLVLFDLAMAWSRLAQRFDAIASPGASVAGAIGIVGYSLLGDLSFACLTCLLLLVRAQHSRVWYAVAAALQAFALVVALVDVASYAYFLQTLDGLDAPLLRHMLVQPTDLSLVLAGEVTAAQWAFLLATFLVLLAAPWSARRAMQRRAVKPWAGVEWRHRRAFALLAAASVPLAVLGMTHVPLPVRDYSLARAPLLQIFSTALFPYQPDPSVDQAVAESRVFEPGNVQIVRTGTGRPRNLVIIVLESTRARSTTPYSPNLRTTPFLAELAKKSLVIDKAYAVMPSTAKALTATFCSIIPAPTIVPVALNAKLLGRCLPQLLDEQGYTTMFMQTANPHFENRLAAVPAMGFQQFIKDEDMPHEGLQEANFLGFEDDAMLKPTADWLRAHKDKPFFIGFLTVDAHHDYNRLTRHGEMHFATNGDDELDRYLNNLYAQDVFLRSLFEIFKQNGAYDNTLFVLTGDHGEAFGEHGRRAHNAIPYEEGLRVPMMFHDPSGTLLKSGHLPGPISQLDIMPTALDLLGFKVSRGRLHGLDIFDSPRERVLMTSCLGSCAARVTDTEAFIHHCGRRPDELYDLRTDPLEQNDLAAQYPQLVARREEELLSFEKRIGSFFFMHELQAQHDAKAQKP